MERCDKECINSTSFFRHLMDDHTDHQVSSHYATLIFKIHEKIAEYDRLFNMLQDDDRKFTKVILKELKSLLENEK
jgi:hypothetical protein